MTRRIFKQTAALLAIGALFAVAAGAANASEVVYKNSPNALPANFASFGNEAYSMAEFGGMVEPTTPGHKSQTVTFAMSAWGCQFGSWTNNTCETPKPGTKFKWPITLNIYEVGQGNTVGAKIATTTKVFKMPYRPTRNPKCGGAGYEQYEKG